MFYLAFKVAIVQIFHTSTSIRICFAFKVVQPRVSLWALALTGGESPASTVEGRVARQAAASRGPSFAVKLLRMVDSGEGLRVLGKFQKFLASDKVDIRQLQNRVNKVEESNRPVFVAEEPGGMNENGKRCLALCVEVQEVASEDSLNPLWVFGVNAAVGHGAPYSSLISQAGHGNFPDSWVGPLGARSDGAAVRHGMLQGIRPAGSCFLGDWHAGVISELVLGQRGKHGVTANSQVWSPHSLDVTWVHSSITHQHLSLTHNFIGPPLLFEVRPVSVCHSVRRNLVTSSVQVVNLRVICPLVRDIERRLDRASVGIEPVPEQPCVEPEIDIIDGIVKGQHDKLRDLFFGQVAWYLCPAAVAVRQLANPWIALASSLCHHQSGSNQRHYKEATKR